MLIYIVCLVQPKTNIKSWSSPVIALRLLEEANIKTVLKGSPY